MNVCFSINIKVDTSNKMSLALEISISKRYISFLNRISYGIKIPRITEKNISTKTERTIK